MEQMGGTSETGYSAGMSSWEPPPARSRIPWHTFYYALAAFDIVTVCISLYLNYRLADLYVQAIASNQEWAQFVADDQELERMAAEVNAAVNDAFDSHETAAAAARVQSVRMAFHERLTALRKDLGATLAPAVLPRVLEGLVDVERGMERSTSDAEGVLHALLHEPGAAASRIRAANRSYAALLAVFREQRTRLGLARAPRPVRAPGSELSDAGTLPPWERFQIQTSVAASLQRSEWAIAALIATMVAGAVVYGRRLARQMDADSRERARFIEALRDARDTLERRVLERTEELHESEQELRRAASDWQHTFEAIGSPVLLADATGRVLRANRAARELAPAVEGQPLASRAGEPWRTAAALLAAVAAGQANAAAEARDVGNGRTWDVAASAVAHDDAEPRAIVVARDVTRIVELQEAVHREARMAAVGQLVAGVAHEVRNPLFGISGTVETLSARLGPDPALEKYFVVLKRDVDRLRALMQDLLDYGKPTRLRLAPTPLGPLVADAIRTCEPLADRRRVEARIPDALPAVDVDAPRMVQVFENLIRNALQHAPVDTPVVVEADTRDAGTVWASVRDFGPGFPAEDLARLFEPFFTKREGGTGLGLSIAQRLVEQHGGTIVAGNHPDGGAVVTLTLPAAGAGRPS